MSEEGTGYSVIKFTVNTSQANQGKETPPTQAEVQKAGAE